MTEPSESRLRQEIYAAFDNFDSNKDGYLSRAELKDLLESISMILNIVITSADIDALMGLDKNADGRIDK